MNCNTTYKMRTDFIDDKLSVSRIAYGIDIYINNSLAISIPDVSFDRESVLKLISLCNSLSLDVIHIYDVIEDFLSTP